MRSKSKCYLSAIFSEMAISGCKVEFNIISNVMI